MKTHYSFDLSFLCTAGNLKRQQNVTICLQACGNYGNTRLFTTLLTLFFMAAFTSMASARTENDISVFHAFTNGAPKLTYTTTSVKCNSGSDGSINLSVTGGKSPYKYKWSNGKTTQDISGLKAGSYYIKVTDSKGKYATKTIHVSQPTSIILTVTATDISCGATTGGIQVSATGGKGGYTFKLKKNGVELASNSTGTFTALSEGTYTVKVKDANGCYKEKTVTIYKAPTFVVTEIIKEPKCFGEKGKITITAAGVPGTPSYSIDGGATFKPGNEFNVVADKYSICVKDSKTGCVVCKDVVVDQPDVITFNAVVTPISCFGGTATITITGVAGGKGKLADFEYSRNGGNTWTADNAFKNFEPGTYSICARDKPECVVCKDVIITEPAVLVATATETDILCLGGTGSITTTTTGGNAGSQTFTLSTGGSNTTGTFTGLTPGSYSVTVTDVKGCTDVSNVVTISQPAAVELTIASTNALCYGGTGTITVTATGSTGKETFTIYKNGVVVGVTDIDGTIFTGLAVGNYSVKVEDANGCTDESGIITITQPAALQILNLTGTCINNLGTVSGNPSGGTGPYDIIIDQIGGLFFHTEFIGSTGPFSSGVLQPGPATYEILIVDANGCRLESSINIEDCSSTIDAAARKGIAISSEDGKAETQVKAFPNPFTSKANIGFSVEQNTHALLEVYSVTGVKVATLYNAQAEAGKVYNVVLNGDKLRAGTYIYRLGTSYGVKNNRIILTK